MSQGRASAGEARLRAAINDLADQLCLSVDGDFDFSVRASVEDETIEKLGMLVNFVLDTARRGMTALRAHNAALAELDRAKTAFFSNVSHEFRTPLTLILGPVEDMLAGRYGTLDEGLREPLQLTQRNALRLLKLVNSLLDFARIDAGRGRALYVPTDLATLTTDLASGFRSAVERAGLRLVVDCPPLGQPFYVDPEMWEQVVFNLLSNALKFTFEGEIRVALGRTETGARLEVSDTGVGIPAEELPRVFSRFHRVPGTRSRTHEGSGIGLALVQELVRLHGGTVEVDSRPGGGTRFTVAIPAGRAHLPDQHVRADGAAPAAPPGRSAEPFLAEAMRWMLEAEEAGPAGEATGAEDGRILVVDDNGDMRDHLRRILAPHWKVEAAADGAAALEMALAHTPDVVVTDVMMPGMDGFELVRRLRAEAATRAVPVIMLSARAGEESRVEGLERGADDYLVKPFTARELVARVQTHLRTARLRERVVAERTRAARTEAELQAFIDNSQAAIFMKDTAGRHLVVNRTFEALAGRPRAEILGRTDAELFGEEVAAGFRRTDAQVVASGEPLQHEHSFEAGGRRLTFLTVKWPLREDGGSLYGVAGLSTDITEQRAVQERLLRESRLRETLHRLGASFASQLDEQKLLQSITDAATSLCEAEFGAFFFNTRTESGGAYMLYTLSGAPRDAFAGFPLPRATPLFEPTFRGEATIRLDDVRRDPRFGRWGPQPHGHLPVVSYLAVPVVAPGGAVLGALFFGHGQPGRFTAEHAALVEGIAGYAAVALENARLYGALQKSQQDARAAYERAAEADRRKDEFLAVLGHELRNPLAPIVTTLQLLRLRGEGGNERELRILDRQVRHLTRLVDDLLDLSRIARGQVHLARERVEMAEVVARGMEQVSPMIEERGHQLSVDVPASGLAVDGDPTRLAQVVANLLGNSARYTDPGGRIEVRAAREADEVVLRVRDTGVGIPAEMLPRVFDLFFQGPQAIDRARGGLGVGLTLVRGLVERHGGSVLARSGGLGRGTEIEVRLPAAAAPRVSGDLGAPAREPQSAKRLLVVDDNEDAADTMAELLRQLGHTVAVAHEPRAALAAAAAEMPDVAFLDIGLPVMDGYELGRRLRGLPEGGELRLIALTGYAQDGDRRRSAEAGFDAHLAKPIDLQELLRILAE